MAGRRAQLLMHMLWVSVLAALPPCLRPEGQKGASEESGLAEDCPLPQIVPHFPKAAPAADGPCEHWTQLAHLKVRRQSNPRHAEPQSVSR